MAHDIHSMVYAGKVPWHGLGIQLPRNSTWEEIREAAGFYRAEERPLFLPGAATPIPDRKALVRADTGDYLATVGDGYEVVLAENGRAVGLLFAGSVRRTIMNQIDDVVRGLSLDFGVHAVASELDFLDVSIG